MMNIMSLEVLTDLATTAANENTVTVERGLGLIRENH